MTHHGEKNTNRKEHQRLKQENKCFVKFHHLLRTEIETLIGETAYPDIHV